VEEPEEEELGDLPEMSDDDIEEMMKGEKAKSG